MSLIPGENAASVWRTRWDPDVDAEVDQGEHAELPSASKAPAERIEELLHHLRRTVVELQDDGLVFQGADG